MPLAPFSNTMELTLKTKEISDVLKIVVLVLAQIAVIAASVKYLIS
jgi:hypothetical protein